MIAVLRPNLKWQVGLGLNSISSNGLHLMLLVSHQREVHGRMIDFEKFSAAYLPIVFYRTELNCSPPPGRGRDREPQLSVIYLSYLACPSPSPPRSLFSPLPLDAYSFVLLPTVAAALPSSVLVSLADIIRLRLRCHSCAEPSAICFTSIVPFSAALAI